MPEDTPEHTAPTDLQFIRPGAKGFIIHRSRVLIIRERLEDGRIIHDIPGGGIDFGETLEEGLKREIFEEVGLQPRVGDIVGSWHFIGPSQRVKDGQVQVLCIGFACYLDDDEEPVVDTTQNPAVEDIFETVWLSKDELVEGKDVYFRSDAMFAAFLKLDL